MMLAMDTVLYNSAAIENEYVYKNTDVTKPWENAAHCYYFAGYYDEYSKLCNRMNKLEVGGYASMYLEEALKKLSKQE